MSEVDGVKAINKVTFGQRLKAYKRSKINEDKKFIAYCKYNKWWLEDYALYMAIKDSLGGISWLEWDENLKLRDKKTLSKYSKKLNEEINKREAKRLEKDSRRNTDPNYRWTDANRWDKD